MLQISCVNTVSVVSSMHMNSCSAAYDKQPVMHSMYTIALFA